MQYLVHMMIASIRVYEQMHACVSVGTRQEVGYHFNTLK